MKELWVPLSGALAQQRQVEVIANNVANANTQGFKKDQIAFREYLTALEKETDSMSQVNSALPNKEWKPDDFYKTQGAENSFVKVDGTYSDFSQGRLSPTNNPFDVAINGKGFFEILTPGGIRFTRNGSFSLNREGILVTTNGHPVLMKAPETADPKEFPAPDKRKIILNNGKVDITTTGEIFIDGVKNSELAIVEFQKPEDLRKEGTTLFVNNNPENIAKIINSTVHQGMIEESNVNALEEMSNLIKANRQFESIQRVIKTYDDIAGKAVNDIAKF